MIFLFLLHTFVGTQIFANECDFPEKIPVTTILKDSTVTESARAILLTKPILKKKSTASLPESKIQKNLKRDVPEMSFGCKREFKVEEKTMPVDSFDKKDGENLRSFVQHSPDATSELDLYVSNRQSAKKAAYVGSIGLAVGIVYTLIKSSTPQTDAGYRAISNMQLAGFGLALGSTIYTLGLLRSNEAHISNAVSISNQAKPEYPIELQFGTSVAF